MNVVNVVLSFITRPNVFHVHCVVSRTENNSKKINIFQLCRLHRLHTKNVNLKIVNLFLIFDEERNKLEKVYFLYREPNRSKLCWLFKCYLLYFFYIFRCLYLHVLKARRKKYSGSQTLSILTDEAARFSVTLNVQWKTHRVVDTKYLITPITISVIYATGNIA